MLLYDVCACGAVGGGYPNESSDPEAVQARGGACFGGRRVSNRNSDPVAMLPNDLAVQEVVARTVLWLGEVVDRRPCLAMKG